MKETLAELAKVVSTTVWVLYTVLLVIRFLYPNIWKFINGGS